MRVMPEIDVLVLSALATKDAAVPILELASELGQDQAKVSAVCVIRAEEGLVFLTEVPSRELRLGARGKELVGRTFPERSIIEALEGAGGVAEIPELATLSGLEAKEVGQSLRWLQAKGWASKEGKSVKLEPGGREALSRRGPDEELVELLGRLGNAGEEAVAEAGIDAREAMRLLEGRSGVVDLRERTLRLARLTDAGCDLVAGGLKARRQVTQLSSEMLISGEWREVELRPYDVTLAAEATYPGKEHPLVTTLQQTRRVFLEMGFSEIVSPYVESCFWDFDALFQPQDHPARDMQDTFYVRRPAQCKLPDDAVVDAVRRTHEDGGDTGSLGWRYRWNPELGPRPLLRTHTTATTIRALARDPKPPRKVFCVGVVFRRETADYKHLPLFHQVDGIIVDDKASFSGLLGTLSAFYRKMGFERFHFQPAFYPYTEPSVDVFVWSEERKDWVEMGGSGVFRPEVTEPLGCTAPVLAWGLGLERVAMFRYGLSSIGELYRARLSWLKETPLCR